LGNPRHVTFRQKIQDATQAGKGGAMVIFVANFDYETQEFELEQLFGKYGTVHDVKICLKGAGQSAGYGFVEMLNDYDAERAESSIRFAIVEMPNDHQGARAIKKLHRKKWCGKRLWIEKAPKAFSMLQWLCTEGLRHPGDYRPVRLDAS